MLSLLRAAPWRALVVVGAAGLVSACEGSAGPAGAKGPAGTACTVTDKGDGTKTVDCGGVKVTLTDGKNGKDGKDGVGKDGAPGKDGLAGKDGTSCSAKKDATTGDVTITCTDGTSAVVSSGKDGKNGSCTASKVSGTTTVTCSDGTTATITDGKDGASGLPGDKGATGTTGDAGKDGSSCTAKDNADGSKTISCTDGTTVTVKNGLNGLSTASTGVNVTVKSVSTVAADPIKVNFTLTDDKGYAIDVCGNYSQNTVVRPSFALAYITKDAAGNVLPYTMLTKSGAALTANPTAYSPLATDCKPATTGQGTLAQNAPGEYTYTFPTTATANGAFAVNYDATKLDNTHVLWMQVTRQTDTVNTTNSATFKAINKEYDFVPSGAGAPQPREIVATSACNACHRAFTPEGSTGNAFHGGGRVEAPFCGVCHNGRHNSDGTVKEAADAMVFVHRLHNSEDINPANLFHAIKFAFPQDIRNCASCHAGSKQPDQWKTRPSREACTSCHDYVDFTGASAATCAIPRAVDTNGVKVMCNHKGGVKADTTCTGCHDAAAIAGYHQTVLAKDPNNSLDTAGGNIRTNAGAMAAAGFVPDKAIAITFDLKEVSTWMDGTVRRPQLTFKFKSRLNDPVANPTNAVNDVVFLSFASTPTTPEMMANFVGAPAVYFAWALPQDGIRMPADYNASGSANLKELWSGVTTDIKTGKVTLGKQGTTDCTVAAPCTCGDGTGVNPAVCKVPKGTLAADSANPGYYIAKLNTVNIAAPASLLAGGLGYAYDLPVNQPLTQTNLSAYPFNAAKKSGGLIVPVPNVWMAATNKAATTGTQDFGYNAVGLCADVSPTAQCACSTTAPCNLWAPRRVIVDNALCLKCHAQLGAAPSFHVGQRNNGPTCSWCHNPNRTSSGWSANSKDFIHGIHAARKRTVPFLWHAVSLTENFGEVEFPGALSGCNACHVAGAFDFSGKDAAAALPRLLPSTVANGKYNNNQVTNTSYYTLSPYVVADNTKDYGAGFSVNSGTGLPTDAALTTLVKSPITAACSACHDSAFTIGHMEAAGGLFYETRATMKASAGEQCMICHGPGKIASIAAAHK